MTVRAETKSAQPLISQDQAFAGKAVGNKLDQPEQLLPANHTVAWEQFKLPENSPAEIIPVDSLPTLDMNDNGSTVTLGSDSFEVSFDRQTGNMTRFTSNGIALLESGLKANFWRAPTDNDLGNGMHDWAKAWKTASDQEKATLVSFAVERLDSHRVQLKAVYRLAAVESTETISYTVLGNGEIQVTSEFTQGEKDLPKLPRLGMQMQIPAEFETMTWLGRGPHESYVDRKTSAAVGLYKGAVWDQMHRYPRPQETANKTDVRWMALTNKDGFGLMAVANGDFLSTSAWHLDMDDLDVGKTSDSGSGLVPVTDKHGADLVKRDHVIWNIDHKQMGVGGDTSWGRPVHPEYSIPAGNYKYSFRLMAVDLGKDDLAVKARKVIQ